MTALDLVGPYQVLAAIPDAQVTLAASSSGPKRTDSGMVIHAEAALRDVAAPDIIVVPGTSRPDLPLADRVLLDWLASVSPGAQWTCSVCTGSLVLGAAGLLRGKRATTHWSVHDALREFGAEPVHERVVFDGALVTAAGVSAGIDMALNVAARIRGDDVAKAIQLIVEYDPQPPFAAGSPASAGPKIVDIAKQIMMKVAPDLRA
jgi:transcriptional regulator GlxA family with amidase domain